LWYNKGIFLFELGNYLEAKEYFDKALEINPQFIIALNNKGSLLYKLENYKGSIEYYDKALAIDEKSSGEYSNALQNFKEISFSSLEAQKHNDIGLCYYQLGIYEEAEELIRSIKENPKIVSASII
jgi:tetratricopeptide (TPR) repeat protein